MKYPFVGGPLDGRSMEVETDPGTGEPYQFVQASATPPPDMAAHLAPPPLAVHLYRRQWRAWPGEPPEYRYVWEG